MEPLKYVGIEVAEGIEDGHYIRLQTLLDNVVHDLRLDLSGAKFGSNGTHSQLEHLVSQDEYVRSTYRYSPRLQMRYIERLKANLNPLSPESVYLTELYRQYRLLVIAEMTPNLEIYNANLSYFLSLAKKEHNSIEKINQIKDRLNDLLEAAIYMRSCSGILNEYSGFGIGLGGVLSANDFMGNVDWYATIDGQHVVEKPVYKGSRNLVGDNFHSYGFNFVPVPNLPPSRTASLHDYMPLYVGKLDNYTLGLYVQVTPDVGEMGYAPFLIGKEVQWVVAFQDASKFCREC